VIGVVKFPGSNCDLDVVDVLINVLKTDAKLVWFGEQDLSDLDGIVIPGGFSYGDHLRAGAIAAAMPILEPIKKFAEKGKPVLGICNGFQVLAESGMLPGALSPNTNMKFICKWVDLKVQNNSSAFTSLYEEGEVVRMPIAHAEGRFQCSSDTLKKIKKNKQICFTFEGENPNGSLDGITGLCNKKGNVVGLMPHPERASETILGGDGGRKMFESMIEYIKK
jgi:phosphoribosylformylglycinamidine synthase